jgi:N-dimethylarginine dimethylaminohydrolase
MSSILVCPPKHYSVDYEINAWMNLNIDVDKNRAELQWTKMCAGLIRSGANLKYIKPHPHFPDMVFTANAGLIHGNTAILSNNKHKERQGESPLFKRWFLENGYKVIELPKHIYFEGAADAMFINDVLFMGHGFRTSKEAHPIIANVFNVEYVSCELVDPHFYHLDTCFLHIKDRIIYYRDAFSNKSIERAMMKLIENCLFKQVPLDILNISESHAKQFVCNSVEIDNNIVAPVFDYDDIFGQKDNVHECDVSEFIKAGGAVKCLTLKL